MSKYKFVATVLILSLTAVAVWAGYYFGIKLNLDSKSIISQINNSLINPEPKYRFNQSLDTLDVSIAAFFQYTPIGGVDTQATVDELVESINNSEYKIIGAINRLAFSPVEDALISRAKAGVDIELVVEDNEFNKAVYKGVRDRFNQAGIKVKLDRPKSNMHNKFFVFDDSLIWVGSTNVTSAEFFQKTNDSMFINSSQLAVRYTEEFNQMFVFDRFGVEKVSGNSPIYNIDGHNVEVYFSPKDRLERHIVSLIEQAQDEILFSTIFFTSNDIANALIDAHNRGVEIKGVWSRRAMDYENTGEDSQYLRLCSNGIDLKISYPYFENHSKFITIDPDTDNAVAVSGSYNWTGTSERENDENIIIFEERRLIEQYYDYYLGTYESIPDSTTCRKSLEIN